MTGLEPGPTPTAALHTGQRGEYRHVRQIDCTLAPEAGERQAITTAHTGLFEDMLQVDFYGAGLDSQRPGNIPVSQSLFHQSGNFLFPRGEIGAARCQLLR